MIKEETFRNQYTQGTHESLFIDLKKFKRGPRSFRRRAPLNSQYQAEAANNK